jgi:hypothetical protein
MEHERLKLQEERLALMKRGKTQKREQKNIVRELQSRLQEQERQTMSWKLAFEEESVRLVREREEDAKLLKDKDENYRRSLEEIEGLYNKQLVNF